VFLISLMGIPPLAGFWGKFAIFGSALNFEEGGLADPHIGNWFLALAVIGVLNATVAAGYYLRVVAAMYFRDPISSPVSSGGLGAALAAGLCALLVVLVGLVPTPLASRSSDAGVALRSPASGGTEQVSATSRAALSDAGLQLTGMANK
jgi:NADH-quinone oxidoreductase subunit N